MRRTANANAPEMITGGDLASSLKMCLISGLEVKRSGAGGRASGVAVSRVTARSKTCLRMGVLVPKDAMTIDARADSEVVRNWNGRSF